MKLKNKLIPLVALATTASVVAPLVTMTSCKTKTTYSFDLVNQEFVYNKGKSLLNSANIVEATTDYVDAITKDPELFVQDYVNYFYLNSLEGIRAGTIKKLKISMTAPVINKIKVVYPNAQSMTYPTISFTFNYDYEDETKDQTETTNNKVSGYVTYDNIPFAGYDSNLIQFAEIEEAQNATVNWTIGVLGVMLKYPYVFDYMNKAWSIKGNFVASETVTSTSPEGASETKEYDFDIDCTKSTDLKELFNTVGNPTDVSYFLLNFESTYLSEVTITPEIEASDFTVTLNSDDNSVLIFGLFIDGEPSGSYTINETIQAPATSASGSSFIGSTLVIEQGAKLVKASDGSNKIYIDSASESTGRVYIQPSEKVEELDKNQTGVFTFPKTISIKEATSGVVDTIDTQGYNCATKSPAKFSDETVISGNIPVTFDGTNMQMTLGSFTYTYGSDAIKIDLDNSKFAIYIDDPTATTELTADESVTQDTEEAFSLTLSASGQTEPTQNTTYTFTDDSQIVFKSTITNKTIATTSLKGWTALYDIGA